MLAFAQLIPHDPLMFLLRCGWLVVLLLSIWNAIGNLRLLRVAGLLPAALSITGGLLFGCFEPGLKAFRSAGLTLWHLDVLTYFTLGFSGVFLVLLTWISTSKKSK